MHHALYSRIFTYCHIRDLVKAILKHMGILTEHKLSKRKSTLSHGFPIRSIACCRLLASSSLEVLKSFSKAPVLVKPVGCAVGCTTLRGWRSFSLREAVEDPLLLWGQAVVCSHVSTAVNQRAAVGCLPACGWRVPALPNAIIGCLLLLWQAALCSHVDRQ